MRDELVGTEVVVWEFGWGPIGKEGEDWLDCDVLVGEAREEGAGDWVWGTNTRGIVVLGTWDSRE